MLNDCNKFFKKRSGSNHETPLNIINQIKPSNIEQGIKSAMMTGNWGKKKGVAQMYPRLTFLQSLSFLRRVDATTGDSSTMKLTGPRHYHPSQVGFLCFTGDTEVLMSDGSTKFIRNIKDGDIVKTFDYNERKIVNTSIKNWFQKDCDELIEVFFSNSKSIKCTPDHKFLTVNSNGFVDIYQMKEIIDIKSNEKILYFNDKSCNNNFNTVSVIGYKYIDPEIVYDFETVSDSHNFIANGLCTANCPIESPEHANIGLVKHLSLIGSITIGSLEQAQMIYFLLNENRNFIHMNNHSLAQISEQTKIFLNGEWIGMSDNPFDLFKELKTLKQNGVIVRTNGLTHDIQKGEIKIYTDSGRLYRPLIRVVNNEIMLTNKQITDIVKDPKLKNFNKWEALIDKYPQAIDYVDMEEQFFNLVADHKDKVIEMKKREKTNYKDSNEPNVNRYDDSLILKYTHCEFHPTMIVGIIAATIPFANHNPGQRNMFQYAK
jgi:DNA-directed RNA polymerase beta subunit